ncbi:DUF2188 domain-containing protein [Bradyrhizobium sp. 41S5]|uniref:DUF2188 domain-containing protein n=1 Tax=Bradyrhizobium sp. 41S5 TaxID=1404443 RepID=UPI001AEDC473|nr:DUF2188 domain-containing protein [Bradyrhizobium sp. 41S5]
MEGCAHCEHSGAYATEEEAIRAAVDAAHKEGKAGRDAQVLVQGHDHRFRNEWTYGTKTYTHRPANRAGAPDTHPRSMPIENADGSSMISRNVKAVTTNFISPQDSSKRGGVCFQFSESRNVSSGARALFARQGFFVCLQPTGDPRNCSPPLRRPNWSRLPR